MPQQIVDLTVTLSNNMPGHQFFPRPVILPHFTHDEMETWGNGTPEDPLGGCTTFLGMIDHMGTHVDSFPYQARRRDHRSDAARHVHGQGGLPRYAACPRSRRYRREDFEEAEKKAGVKIDGHIVLICTGLHSRHYPTDKVVWSNHGITAEATHWLADRSRVHGVEGPSTDRPNSNLFPNHRVCRDRGITHYEWLCNLEELLGKGEFDFRACPSRSIREAARPSARSRCLDEEAAGRPR